MHTRSIIKAASRNENWPAVIDNLRHGDLISIEEQKVLADLIEILFEKYEKKLAKEKRHNTQRRNIIDGQPTKGRLEFSSGQEWIKNARADRANVKVERYVGEGMARADALIKASHEFGYKINAKGKGESLRQTLNSLHKEVVCTPESGPPTMLVSALKKELRHGEEIKTRGNHRKAT